MALAALEHEDWKAMKIAITLLSLALAAALWALMYYMDTRLLAEYSTAPIQQALADGRIRPNNPMPFLRIKPYRLIYEEDADRKQWSESIYDDRQSIYVLFAVDQNLYAVRKISDNNDAEWVFRDDEKLATYFRLRRQ